TAPPTANDSRKYASICKNRFFSGFLGDCAVEKFLKNTEGSCKLNELVSVVAATDSTGTLRRSKTSMNPKKLA
ncbi:hypothetical protein ACQP3I_25440, partial [Escherichia coli]